MTDINETINDLKECNKEHDAWTKMFNEFCRVNNLSHEQANGTFYRRFFFLIEKWGIELFLLREKQIKMHPEKREEYLKPFFKEENNNE